MSRRVISILIAATALIAVAAGTGASTSSRAATIGQLSSQLRHERARQRGLSASVGRLSHTIASLASQVTLVQAREAAVRVALQHDRAALARVRLALAREQRLTDALEARLARARMILARQLVSSYEGDTPDLVSVVLDAHGFSDLLEKLDFLRRAEQQQQSLITTIKQAEQAADRAKQRLAALEARQLALTGRATLRLRALSGMNALLRAKQTALARARAAQQATLEASRAKSSNLQAAIARLQAEQEAAQRAAAAAAASSAAAASPGGAAGGGGSTLGPSDGWAIPYAIVLCESGAQNLPPNSAGASGYYQILPSTWKLYGGIGPAAYLASKAEQDAVAARIWNGGAGASSWACASIVGGH